MGANTNVPHLIRQLADLAKPLHPEYAILLQRLASNLQLIRGCEFRLHGRQIMVTEHIEEQATHDDPTR
eukprot:1193936-Prorocentrum_minimum.AAC.2